MLFRREYKVGLGDEWIVPEETLLDSSSSHSDVEAPIPGGVFKYLSIIALILFAVIISFSVKISVYDHKTYASLAEQNRSVNVFVPAPRGMILDRAGVPLTENVSRFDLIVIGREVRESIDVLTESSNKIGTILGIDGAEFERNIRETLNSQSVFFAVEGLSKDQVLSLSSLQTPGFYVVPTTQRTYVDGIQFSQIIGYTGKVNKEDLEDPYYKSTDTIGRLGLESYYEETLRGEHGLFFFHRDKEQSLNKQPSPGNNLVLNIDYDLQKSLYNEVYAALKAAGLSRATAIIQNPSNGSVMAMVSFPTYNNNDLVDGVSASEYKTIFGSVNKPLFNRVIGGLYNPGSVIKPLMGLMILEENVFTPTDNIRDCISLSVPNPFNPDQPSIFKNWRADTGLFNMRKAIAQSCNVYFFIGGGGFGSVKGLGITKISDYLNKTLARSVLGIDLIGEQEGFIPTPDWKKETRGEDWYQGDTYNVSIGQGDLLVTPLWINSYISAIANGGTIFKPRVVSKVIDGAQVEIESFPAEKLASFPFSESNISEMRRNMEETVLTGTAKILQGLPVRSGAKTGTAEVQKGKTVNSLFAAFAPYENPEIAITILVEGSASNEGAASRAAYNVLKSYFGTKELVLP